MLMTSTAFAGSIYSTIELDITDVEVKQIPVPAEYRTGSTYEGL